MGLVLWETTRPSPQDFWLNCFTLRSPMSHDSRSIHDPRSLTTKKTLRVRVRFRVTFHPIIQHTDPVKEEKTECSVKISTLRWLFTYKILPNIYCAAQSKCSLSGQRLLCRMLSERHCRYLTSSMKIHDIKVLRRVDTSTVNSHNWFQRLLMCTHIINILVCH